MSVPTQPVLWDINTGKAVDVSALAPTTPVPTTLVQTAVSLGAKMFIVPFPGEPSNTRQEVRDELWRMKLITDDYFLKDAQNHKSKITTYLNRCCMGVVSSGIAASAGVVAAICLYGYSSDQPGLMQISIVISNIILSLSPLVFSIFVASKIDVSKDSELGVIEEVSEKLSKGGWPGSIQGLLNSAIEKDVTLSLELKAFHRLLSQTSTRIQEWSGIPLEDYAAMAALYYSFRDQKADFCAGATLSLSGESSELLHRVCNAVKPGRLEQLIERVESPPRICA